MKFLMLVTCAIACGNIYASEPIPEAILGTYVEEYCYQGECQSDPFTTTEFVKRTKDSVYINIRITNKRGGCGFNGIGRLENDYIVGTGKSNVDGTYCKIKFSFEGGKLNLSEYGGECKSSNYCSYGVNILSGVAYVKK